MNVDREQQKEILQLLFKHFPWKTNEVCQRINSMIKEDEARTVGNLLYLQMHGLINPCIEIIGVGHGYSDIDPEQDFPSTTYVLSDRIPTLTEKGIDFLLGDEGLSAILNVQTVRIHDDSIKALLSALVESSAMADDAKHSLIEKIKEAPLQTLQHLLNELGSQVLSQSGAAGWIVHALQSAFLQ